MFVPGWAKAMPPPSILPRDSKVTTTCGGDIGWWSIPAVIPAKPPSGYCGVPGLTADFFATAAPRFRRGRWCIPSTHDSPGMPLMNHGLITFERDEIGARVWRLAMAQGRFVAAYMGRSIERSFRAGETWRGAYVGQCAPPASYCGEDFGRYEPEYEQLFVRMCNSLVNTATPSIAVPHETNATEAMGILDALDAESADVFKRLVPDVRRKRRHSREKVSDLLRRIPVRPPWAYVLNYFYEDTCTIFLAEDAAVVRALESLDPDERHFRVMEKW